MRLFYDFYFLTLIFSYLISYLELLWSLAFSTTPLPDSFVHASFLCQKENETRTDPKMQLAMERKKQKWGRETEAMTMWRKNWNPTWVNLNVLDSINYILPPLLCNKKKIIINYILISENQLAKYLILEGLFQQNTNSFGKLLRANRRSQAKATGWLVLKRNKY